MHARTTDVSLKIVFDLLVSVCRVVTLPGQSQAIFQVMELNKTVC